MHESALLRQQSSYTRPQQTQTPPPAEPGGRTRTRPAGARSRSQRDPGGSSQGTAHMISQRGRGPPAQSELDRPNGSVAAALGRCGTHGRSDFRSSGATVAHRPQPRHTSRFAARQTPARDKSSEWRGRVPCGEVCCDRSSKVCTRPSASSPTPPVRRPLSCRTDESGKGKEEKGETRKGKDLKGQG